MLRRLAADQPAAFAFTPANAAWAEAQVQKYPEGRQASAIIPLLWRAQEQEGWLSKPAIEHVADRLGMPYIRALEVATFYFMFQLTPVGSVAHVQVCGTLSCMITGAEDLIALCQRRISPEAHHPSADGKLSWEEVECLGACANAPMAQIGKDYYEDLTVESLGRILDALEAGEVPTPGPQDGRFAAEPAGGPTTLTQWVLGREAHNGSVGLALEIGDTVRRIDGTEVPLVAPWIRGEPPQVPPREGMDAAEPDPVEPNEPKPAEGEPADATGATVQEAKAETTGRPVGPSNPDPGLPDAAPAATGPGMEPPGGRDSEAGPGHVHPEAAHLVAEQAPTTLEVPREGRADDLKLINGIGPRLEQLLNELGFWHFDQIAAWGPGEVAWVNSRLGSFRGRIERDDWIEQARAFAGRR